MNIERPIVFFDLETTGIDFAEDRIVEICMLKYFTDGSEEVKTYLVNPQRRIPPESSAIHGIKDEDVKDKPTFKELAPEIMEYMTGCDIAGYNIIKFDIPFIRMEFMRNGFRFGFDGVNVIDPYVIFVKKEQRNLAAALRFYCNEEIVNAHSAEADTIATKKVLFGQLAYYNDLPGTMGELNDFIMEGTRKTADISGRLVYNENKEVVFNFGKYKGERVADNIDFARWMLTRDFPEDTKEILRSLI
jgi:DNA polymerase-3 subunit epsilon